MSEPAGQLKAFLPGGTDRLENAVAHLRELLEDESDGKPVGVLLFWKTADDDGNTHFFDSIFGKLTESDVAYMSVILADLAMRRKQEP